MVVNATISDPLPEPGRQRRLDYRLVQVALDAETLDLGAVRSSWWACLLLRVAGNYVALAAKAFVRVLRGGIDCVLCDNENEAMVLALLLKLSKRRTALLTYAITPAARKKCLFFLVARGHSHVDRWLNYSGVQADLLVTRRGVPRDRVQVVPSHTDALFFRPEPIDAEQPAPRPYILAVGRQHRDYPLLVDATGDLPIDLVIDASSPHTRWPDSLAGRTLPPSIRLVSLDSEQLRAAYASAAIVVVPTVESDFGAGQTTLLEAMAMARPVVATRTAGGGDLLADRRSVLRGGLARPTAGLFAGVYLPGVPDALGPHGYYVAPGDVDALRGVIRYLLDHPEEAAEMGRRGRALVLGALTIDHFRDRVVAAVSEVRAARVQISQ